MRNYSRKFRRNVGGMWPFSNSTDAANQDTGPGMVDTAKEKAKNAYSSFTNMFSSSNAPAPTSGGRRSRRRQSRKNRNRRSRR
jgi:hypothetical protein